MKQYYFKNFQTSLLKRGARGVFFITLFLLLANINAFAAASFNGATVNSAQTICFGSIPTKLTLTIATCPGALSAYSISAYEWQSSSDNSTWAKVTVGTGATTNAYAPPALTTSKYYRCKITVTGMCSTFITSPYYTASVKITVNSATSITINPSNQIVCLGSTATFSVVASGTSLTYQWQSCKTPTGTYANISGATSATYSITASTTNNGWFYKCIVGGSCGTSQPSSYAKLTLNTTTTSITTPPSNQIVCLGSAATFTVAATGSGLTYQWQSAPKSTGTFTNILGETSATYAVNGSSSNNGFYYTCVVTGACASSKTSTAASITVNELTNITTNPSDQTVCDGSTATFSVVAVGTGLTYQWQSCTTEKGTYSNINSNATSAKYNVNANALNNGTYYKCIVSGTCGSQTSSVAKLSLYESASITTQPSSTTVLQGKTANFFVVATGSGLTYQWQKCATSTGIFKSVGGSTGSSNSYALTTALTDDGYYYRCIVSGTCNQITSDVVQLTVGKAFSDTLTLTQSNLSTSPIRFYDRTDYSGLTYSLQKATLNVLMDLGDDYSLGIAPSYSASLTVSVQGYDSNGTAIASSKSKTITLSGSSASIEAEKLTIVDLNPLITSNPFTPEKPITKTPYADVDYYSISYVLASGAPSQLRVKTWVDEDYTVNVNSGTYKTASLITLNEVSLENNTANFSWSPAIADYVDDYQIQVLRLYNQDDANKKSTSLTVNSIDWDKALTLEVEGKTSLSLEMVEGTGYYAWRIRPIGDYFEGGIANSLNWGVWSTHTLVAQKASYSVSAVSGLPNYIFYNKQLDQDKNWIYNRTFTEDNSIAQGISYATGLGQVKQSQRLLMEQASILANQKAYDYCGRPAIQTLTAPINQAHLGYVESLIKDSTGNLYGPDDFDTEQRVHYADDLGKVPVWENPKPVFGAINQFYSDTNPDLGVPNAGNFPYARTLYHQDGRVKKQSLFGDEHRLGLYDKTYDEAGLQRTIRTYYSAVSDSELLKVFGNETPHDTNIYKVITVDPNDRPFVEYKTIDGNTIATAYINTGQHPLLDDVWADPKVRTKKLIEGEVMADPTTIVREQSIAFAEPKIQIKLQYKLDPSEDFFNANCISYCRTCDYSVYLYVIREETDELKWKKEFTIGGDVCGKAADTTYTDSFTLDDPGVYRFGRKITVNNIKEGETHFSDYYETAIGEKMDEKVLSKFDKLKNYLSGTLTDENGDALAPDLDKLNRYLNKLAGVSTSSAATKVTSATTAFTDLSLFDNDDDITVSYDSKADEYTLKTHCTSITIPKISCGEDICADYWMPYDDKGDADGDIDDDGTIDYPHYNSIVANLFKEDGGYYDFENILYNKAKDEEWEDANGNALSNKLYKYFYDKDGEYLYPTGNKYSYTSVIKISPDNSQDNFVDGNDELIWATPYTYVKDNNDIQTIAYSCNTLKSGSDLTTEEIPYLSVSLSINGTEILSSSTMLDPARLTTIEDRHDESKTASNNGLTSHYEACSISLSDYADALKDYLQTLLAPYQDIYDIDIDVSAVHQKATDKEDAVSKLEITISSDVVLKLSLDLGASVHLNASVTDFHSSTSATNSFPNATGALNAMLNHMILDEQGDKAYDCMDVLMAVEKFTDDWDGLYASKGSSTAPGTNFMDYLLNLIGSNESADTTQLDGKQYSGFSNHPYGNGDADFPSLLAPSQDYGLGYLEYAYKSFNLDVDIIVLDASIDPLFVLTNNQESCFNQYGIDISKNPSDWSTPSGESLDDSTKVWDVATCGSAAWWDASTSSIIADDRSESQQCKIWDQLYTCIQSDEDQAEAYLSSKIIDNSTYIGSGAYNISANAQFSGNSTTINKLIDTKIDKAVDLRLPSVKIAIEKADVKSKLSSYLPSLNATPVHALKYQLRDELKNKHGKLSELSAAAKTKADSLTVYKNAQKLVAGFIDVTFDQTLNDKVTLNITPSGYTFLDPIKTSKSEILKSELNQCVKKYGNAPSRSEINNWIDSIADAYEININPLSTFKLVKSSGFFADSTSFSNKDAVFSVNAGQIKFFDGKKTETLMNINNTLGGDESYEAPAMGYKLSDRSSITATLSAQKQKKKACNQDNIDYVLFILESELEQSRKNEVEASLDNYYTACTLPDNIVDTFMVEYGIDYVHFTLFYYDVNGNLIKTVPPKGVDMFEYTVNEDGEVIGDRPSRMDVKNHTLTTEYQYNSLGQKTYEKTPDGGITQFWYNNIGQLRFSQNAAQFKKPVYSYIKYDHLGRPTESGQSSLQGSSQAFAANVDDDDFPASNNTDKTISVYNDAVSGLSYISGETLEQEFLENRVSYSYSDADGTDASGDEIYTYYSYSPHGMVEWMLQSIPGIDNKYIEYQYDLISGKITQISYNPGKVDQFFHKYVYDSDNRIEKTQSSRDGYLWDTDAQYKYYAYGPLKRLSIGEDKVQGLDYVYTINGWLKAVNHQSLSATYDPGNDGGPDSKFATDAFGYTLGYFEGDFKRGIDTTGDGKLDDFSPFNSEFSDATSNYYSTGINQLDWYRDGGSQKNNYKPLFDGSITNMAYNVKDPSGSMNHTGLAQGFMFNYDELNRLTKASYDYSSGTGNTATFSQTTTKEYLSTFSYDENGNIDTLSRYASYDKTAKAVTKMDSLIYNYNASCNQINHVDDAFAATSSITTDIEDQSKGNYDYDAIGQLIQDNAEGIENIKWTPAHKVEKVTYTSGKTISFTYNSLGYRSSKIVSEPTTLTSAGPTKLPTTHTLTTTYYVTDVNGNVMAIYTSPSSGTDATLSELPIYGTSRMGEYKSAAGIDPDATISSDEFTRTVGNKYYELSDHLGNVRAVVEDVKASDGSATVVSATDYYPYGMEMPGRTYSSSDYRYGYQGKEKDDDVKSNGNSYDFGARFYDPRLGRWLSRDPLAEKYADMSPYNAFANNPINMVDPDGKEYHAVVLSGQAVVAIAASMGIQLSHSESVGYIAVITSSNIYIFEVSSRTDAVGVGLTEGASGGAGGGANIGYINSSKPIDESVAKDAMGGKDVGASTQLRGVAVLGASCSLGASQSATSNENLSSGSIGLECTGEAGEGAGVGLNVTESTTTIRSSTSLFEEPAPSHKKIVPWAIREVKLADGTYQIWMSDGSVVFKYPDGSAVRYTCKNGKVESIQVRGPFEFPNKPGTVTYNNNFLFPNKPGTVTFENNSDPSNFEFPNKPGTITFEKDAESPEDKQVVGRRGTRVE